MSIRRFIFLAFIFLLTFYVSLWLKRITKPKIPVWLMAPLIFIGATGWQFAYRYSVPTSELARNIYYWGSAVLLSFFVVFLLLALPFDIVRIVTTLAAKIFGASDFSEERRDLLKKGSAVGLLGATAVIGTWGAIRAVQTPKVKEVLIPLKNLPEAFQDFKIAQISDLHVGPTIRRAYVEKVVEATNLAAPHVVSLTGDFVDGYVRKLVRDVEPLGRLEASHGKFFVTGNHEYYWGCESWLEHFKTLGVEPLINEHRILSHKGAEICIAGVTDTSSDSYVKEHFSNPHEAIRGVNPTLTKILLAHRPQSCFEASKAGFDFQICGHTHAGQFFPWNLFVPLAHPYYKGLNLHENMHVYVNPGTGYWGPPNRFAVPMEITVFRLVKT